MIFALKKAFRIESSNVSALIANIINSFIYMITSIVLVLTFVAIKETENYSRDFLLCLFFGFQSATNLFWIFFTGVINYPFTRIGREDEKYFMYPRSVLSSVILDGVTVFDFPLFLINYCLFVLFGINEGINLLFCLIPFFGSLILASCFVIIAALIFITRFFQNVASFIFMISEMAQYPASIYPLVIKIVLIFIPLSFVTYYPLQWIVEMRLVYFGAVLIGAVILFAISACFFAMLSKKRNEIYD